MAPVMHVSLHDRSAILKVYDRRCGIGLRDCYYEYIPCTTEVEASYQSFLRRGSMRPFLEEMDQDEASSEFPLAAAEIREGPEGMAKYEAALWRITNQQFKTEVEVYERLKDLQGILIPELYALVRVASGPNSESSNEDYQTVYGILLEPIPGCNLYHLADEETRPTTEQEWTSIIQRAIDATYEVNKRGIILDDSSPRNVVVKASTFQPFLVDFAQCWFKDKMIREWVESGRAAEQGDDWDDDAEFCETARTFNNSRAVGLDMMKILQKAFGFKVEVKYPKAEELLHYFKSQPKPEITVNEPIHHIKCHSEPGIEYAKMDEPLHDINAQQMSESEAFDMAIEACRGLFTETQGGTDAHSL
ncbi:hypothetical protein IL306_006529 [Fusarium sp. DS 682]|nr:hypothetical protein IL306_006529 [Fusarium sp. DS 682]